MLGTKVELGRGTFGEMYVYLQPVAKPCCFTLPDVPYYLKSHYAATQCHVYVIGPFHLHSCKLIKYMSLCVVDLLFASFRFNAYIDLQVFDS